MAKANITEASFYESQNMFRSLRVEKNLTGSCYYQVYDLEQGFLVEKWVLEGKLVLVEFYRDGKGFHIYTA